MEYIGFCAARADVRGRGGRARIDDERRRRGHQRAVHSVHHDDLAEARSLAVDQGGDGDRRAPRALLVAQERINGLDRAAVERGLPPRCAGRRSQQRVGLGRVGGAVDVGRHVQVDQRGPRRAAGKGVRRGGEPERGGPVGARGDHHVGCVQQGPDGGRAGRLGEDDLVAVPHGRAGQVAGPAAAAVRLDPQHLGAEIGEQHRGDRPGHVGGAVEDAQSVQRAGLTCWACHRWLSVSPGAAATLTE